MKECPIFSLEMLAKPIDLQLEDEGLDFGRAKKKADETVENLVGEAMLLAWYVARTGEYAPDIPCCQTDKPPWLAYAQSRGGNLAVVINNGDYVFIYRQL